MVINRLEILEAKRNKIFSRSSGLSKNKDDGKKKSISLFAEANDEKLGIGALAKKKNLSKLCENRIDNKRKGVSLFAKDNNKKLSINALANEKAMIVIIK